MPMTINERELLREDFLEGSFKGIVEIGRELLSCVYGSEQEEVLGAICNRLRRIKKNAVKLNFSKIEEVTGLLESILYHVGVKKLLVDERLIRMCLQANNLCCDILKSIKTSGREQSEKYPHVIGTMMRYLDFTVIREYPIRDGEVIDNSVDRVGDWDEERLCPDGTDVVVRPENGDRKILDTMLDAVGELVANGNEIEQYVGSKDDFELKKMGKNIRITADRLHDEILSMKTMAVKEMLFELDTMVKKVAKKHKKQVRLEMTGLGIGIDKDLSDIVKRSLFDLVSYAVIYGMEGPEERLALGKREEGRIGVKAYNDRGRIILEICDDGREAKPEFEKDSVLSAVKDMIEERDGSVEVKYSAGEGTVFSVSLPVASEVLSVLLVESSGVHFCIEHDKVDCLELMDEKSVVKIRDRDFYHSRGKTLPVIRMNKFFDLPRGIHDDYKVVIVEGEKSQFAIEVDAVLGSQNVVVKNIDMGFSDQNIYMGATLAKKGNVSFVVDVDKLYCANFDENKIKLVTPFSDQEHTAKKSKEEGREIIVFQHKDEKIYGVPIVFVEKVKEIATGNIEWSGEIPIIRYNNRALPIVNLKPNETIQRGYAYCMIFDVNGIKKGFVVNNVLGLFLYEKCMDENHKESGGVMETICIDKKSIIVINPQKFWTSSSREYQLQ